MNSIRATRVGRYIAALHVLKGSNRLRGLKPRADMIWFERLSCAGERAAYEKVGRYRAQGRQTNQGFSARGALPALLE